MLTRTLSAAGQHRRRRWWWAPGWRHVRLRRSARVPGSGRRPGGLRRPPAVFGARRGRRRLRGPPEVFAVERGLHVHGRVWKWGCDVHRRGWKGCRRRGWWGWRWWLRLRRLHICTWQITIGLSMPHKVHATQGRANLIVEGRRTDELRKLHVRQACLTPETDCIAQQVRNTHAHMKGARARVRARTNSGPLLLS